MRQQLTVLACGAALLFAAGCGDTNAPTTGGLNVSVTTTGGDPDLDGYLVTVDGAAPQPVAVNGQVAMLGLATGPHDVELSGMAGNCTVSGENPRLVTITAGETDQIAFQVGCVATGVQVTTATTGVDIDPDGYSVSVDGAPPLAAPTNGTLSITRLSPGSHTVTLSGVVGNCAVSGTNPRSVSVAAGEVVPVATFEISCTAVTGVIEVTSATSGVDLDQNGYQVQLDGATSQPLGLNGIVRFTGVSGGAHQVALGDAAPNCTVSGENPRTLSVTTGGVTRDTARTTFQVTCEPATGTVRVITTTTGADLDPDGYSVGLDCYVYYGYEYCSHSGPVGVNETLTLGTFSTGDHQIELRGVASNCDLSEANPRTVRVTGGVTTDITFTVSCSALGSISVTTTTTGVDFDANGYRVEARGARQTTARDVPANGTSVISGLRAGDYNMTLGGVAANCDAVGPNPRTVSVPAGATAAVTFDVACAQATQLAVTLTVNGNTDIYVVKSNGADLTRLTTDAGADVGPAWSPDGSRIAFTSSRDGNQEIYVMNADGSGQTRLTNNPAGDGDPTWSPEGSRLAFVSARDGNDYEIYVMNADGTTLVRLTNNPAHDLDPAWSPDGSTIAFSSGRDGNNEIYVMSPAGSGVTRLTSNTVGDIRPAWSRDGAKLAFSRLTGCDYYTSFCDYDLFVMNADGSGAARLTSGSSDSDAAWSPDDRWIAFSASFCASDYYYGGCSFSHNAVHLVRADGTRLVDLLRDAFQPAWRP